MIMIASKVSGKLNEFSSRVPSAIAATLLLLVTFFLGRMLINKEAGFISALVLATNYQYMSNARESVMDMTFAFFIGLTIFLNYLAITKEKRILLCTFLYFRFFRNPHKRPGRSCYSGRCHLRLSPG